MATAAMLYMWKNIKQNLKKTIKNDAAAVRGRAKWAGTTQKNWVRKILYTKLMEQRWLDEMLTCFVEWHSSGFLTGYSCQRLITPMKELFQNDF